MINAAAAAYLVEHQVAEAVITALLVDEHRSFADDAAWQAHLDRLNLGPGQRRLVTLFVLDVPSVAVNGSHVNVNGRSTSIVSTVSFIEVESNFKVVRFVGFKFKIDVIEDYLTNVAIDRFRSHAVTVHV